MEGHLGEEIEGSSFILAQPQTASAHSTKTGITPNVEVQKMHCLLRWKIDFNIFLLMSRKDAETWSNVAGIAVEIDPVLQP